VSILKILCHSSKLCFYYLCFFNSFVLTHKIPHLNFHAKIVPPCCQLTKFLPTFIPWRKVHLISLLFIKHEDRGKKIIFTSPHCYISPGSWNFANKVISFLCSIMHGTLFSLTRACRVKLEPRRISLFSFCLRTPQIPTGRNSRKRPFCPLWLCYQHNGALQNEITFCQIWELAWELDKRSRIVSSDNIEGLLNQLELLISREYSCLLCDSWLYSFQPDESHYFNKKTSDGPQYI
jgi:hypothetical protein